jgi:hypothetical protein
MLPWEPTYSQMKAMADRVVQATASIPGGPTLQDILKATDAEFAAFRARRGRVEASK